MRCDVINLINNHSQIDSNRFPRESRELFAELVCQYQLDLLIYSVT